ncbi:Peptidase m14 carboxypeptidase a [Hyella patelloides LEGE 07179]|uniref:Peptidase m14 carboxypeptidase a n=1 Tax=Hyella patelloides LEGE 07179 TaxID=945734 RepID=A0A563VK01_9CYAN|nr:M14 family zinc carboxypeptidase [Hyella patelloides]VEP11615.1 Peptidase m14 carboxypeptidase a [Hyella patelloides LEGE 07179]
MKWNDLKQLEGLLLETEKHGAIIKEIGRSLQQQPIYSVSVGDKNPDHTIVAIAGMHATEVVGQLALVDLISKLNSENTKRLRYHFVPIADPDFLAENVQQLSEPITLPKLLSLKSIRDLEGYFTSNRYPECEAIRQLLETFPRIDAFFSLHTAPVAPGLFFYVAGKSNDCIASVADRIATMCQPSQIPLLEKDPTVQSQKALFPGFFTIPTAAEMNSSDDRDRCGTSLEFVAKKFQPSFIGVSEIPLGICTRLHNAPIEKIESFNKQLAQNAKVDLPYQELDLSTQIDLIHELVLASGKYLLKQYR